jgi:outer membrane protein OmpA-like peptidoglycan-associated protein
VLDELKAFLATHPAPQITVIGHTDRMGTVEYNDALSRQRAETVRELLVEVGIQASSMDVAGRGEREPLVPTADEVPEERNRRVEINVR